MTFTAEPDHKTYAAAQTYKTTDERIVWSVGCFDCSWRADVDVTDAAGPMEAFAAMFGAREAHTAEATGLTIEQVREREALG